MKLFDSELRVMEVLWQEGALPARRVAEILGEKIGWNKNTTYTVIKKCVEKGAVAREEPDFVCCPLVDREAVQKEETDALINKMFGGSSQLFFSSFLRQRGVSEKEAERLLRLIDGKGGEEG
jgi:BlaI family penicillinase repressor